MTTHTTPQGAGAIIARCFAFVTGFALIGAAANYQIKNAGGYIGPTGYISEAALMYIALAVGLAAGAITVGYLCRSRRWTLAVCTVIAVVAGEGNGLVNTAERTIAHRDAAQAPLRAAHTERVDAAQRIADAEAKLAAMVTSPRIKEALTAKAAADKAIADNAGGAQCKQHCKDLLLKSQTVAATDVAQARAALELDRETVRQAIEAQRAALAALPVPASDSPLADRLGVPGWQIDLLVAVLVSLAVNGLAFCLLAFSTHGGHVPAPAQILVQMPAAANDLEPGPGTPIVSGDRVVDWARAYRARHGRLPQIPEVMAEFSDISRSTAWRRIKAA